MNTELVSNNLTHATETGFGVNTETGLARGGLDETAVLLMD